MISYENYLMSVCFQNFDTKLKCSKDKNRVRKSGEHTYKCHIPATVQSPVMIFIQIILAQSCSEQTLLVKTTSKTKIWPDIVQWQAIIFSPDHGWSKCLGSYIKQFRKDIISSFSGNASSFHRSSSTPLFPASNGPVGSAGHRGFKGNNPMNHAPNANQDNMIQNFAGLSFTAKVMSRNNVIKSKRRYWVEISLSNQGT